MVEKGKEGNPISPKRKREIVVLTKVDHAAEQPRPSRQWAETVIVVVVGRLGLHVYDVYVCKTTTLR
jgi:hypothetical protein